MYEWSAADERRHCSASVTRGHQSKSSRSTSFSGRVACLCAFDDFISVRDTVDAGKKQKYHQNGKGAYDKIEEFNVD